MQNRKTVKTTIIVRNNELKALITILCILITTSIGAQNPPVDVVDLESEDSIINFRDNTRRLLQDIEYKAEAVGTFSFNSRHTPLWLNSNKYGLGGVKESNGHIRAGVFRNYGNDSTRKWKIGYGADLAVAYNYTGDFIVQQLYTDFGYKKLFLSVGAKERHANLKNDELSSGSQTFGINARPIPEVRIELPEYISISNKCKWFALRGHIGYGITTDGNWQKSFSSKGNRYTKKVLYHSKSGFVRIGNEKLFPVVFEGGVEMAATFGGRYYDGNGNSVNMYNGLKDFYDVFFVKGYDYGETIYKNAKGNTVGSWLFSLKYKGENWAARLYYDHFFEDHSAMFWQYGWKDGMYGAEFTLPYNRFISSLVYEYIYTKYQSGPIYHDQTQSIKDQISATDNYYNHELYSGWQHWGQAIGNPLYISPIYNSNGMLTFWGNRFSAHHIGLCGNPINSLHYKMLFTYSQQLGTYKNPYEDKKYQRSFLCELTYSPRNIGKLKTNGWSAMAAFALDRGSATGNNTGFQITIRKSGVFSF